MYQYEKPEKKLLGEQIEDELMRYILQEPLEVGQKLPNEFELAEKFGVSSSAIGRRAVQECWHGTDAQRANARLRNLAAGLRRQAEQRLAGELDTREIKELTAVLRELMNLQQTLEGQQPGGSPLRVVLEEETEDWSV